MTPPPSSSKRPGWGTLLLRGLTKRCPNCGNRKIFKGWFRMVERCPGCGIKFEREPGFFVGAYLINFATTVVLLFIISMGFVAMKAIDENAKMTGPLILGLIVAAFVPPFFYPISRTFWSALDIGSKPLEAPELAAAAEALASGNVGHVQPEDPRKRTARAAETVATDGDGSESDGAATEASP